MMSEKAHEKFTFSINGKNYEISEKKESRKKEKKFDGPSIGIGAGIGAIFLALVLFSLNGLSENDNQSIETNDTINPVQISDDVFLKHGSPILGSPNAPITLIEFGDFQCHFCNVHFQNTEHRLLEEYVATGKINIIFKDFIIVGPPYTDSINAAHAAHCAGEQNKYWVYHNTLYNNWSGENSGWVTNQNLVKFANEIKLKIEPFKECMDSKRYNETIQHSVLDAQKLGITGTPAFFIIDNNDKQADGFQGAQPFETFERVIESMLEN